MSHVSEPHFLVLHGLRLKGFAAEMAIARLTGLAPAEVDTHLSKLAADGLAQHREGRITGWALTPSGRAQHAEDCAAEVAAAGCRAAIEDAYRRFLDINHDFLAVCTDWQLRTADGAQVMNDHSDAMYDGAVVDRLRALDVAVQPICDDLGAAMARFKGYGPRLGAALEKVESGADEWFTGALIESYHTIWFELHEDLLATLGVARGSEAML